LLLKLESAHNALQAHHNFNLAEVLISEYYKELPPKFQDADITKAIFDGLRKRDAELLYAAIEAEMERLRVEKIKLLREEIIQS